MTLMREREKEEQLTVREGQEKGPRKVRHKIVRKEAREQERRGRDLFSYLASLPPAALAATCAPLSPPIAQAKASNKW